MVCCGLWHLVSLHILGNWVMHVTWIGGRFEIHYECEGRPALAHAILRLKHSDCHCRVGYFDLQQCKTTDFERICTLDKTWFAQSGCQLPCNDLPRKKVEQIFSTHNAAIWSPKRQEKTLTRSKTFDSCRQVNSIPHALLSTYGEPSVLTVFPQANIYERDQDS